MGGCFTFVMLGTLAFGLAVAFACLRSKRDAGGESFAWVAVVAVVLFATGLPLAVFALRVFFAPA